MSAHSTAVANEFIRLAKKAKKTLTQMQLQKLVYIANGWNLAINEVSLTEDSPRAWDYGPVYKDMWEALRVYGRDPISRPIKVKDYGFGILNENADDDVRGDFSNDETALIEKVFDVYGGFHAFQLSALTHKDGTPWHDMYVTENRSGGRIADEAIQSHFIKIIKDGRENSHVR